MVRIALGLEYDGTKFNGWQVQPNQRTVQGCLIEAISYVANHDVKTVAAGRTDSGVHALQQVIHFDTKAEREQRNWILGLNTHLPKDVNVIWAKSVGEEFSARFSAISRSYRYLILNRVSRSSIHHNKMWWCTQTLNVELMQEAASLMVGHHDFSAFRAKECQAHDPVKTMEYIKVSKQGDCIAIDVKAQSFLHHMVRNIVGVLVPIGDGRKPVSWALDVLESRDRTKGGVTSPPEGLYFVNAHYPTEYAFPTVSTFPVVW